VNAGQTATWDTWCSLPSPCNTPRNGLIDSGAKTRPSFLAWERSYSAAFHAFRIFAWRISSAVGGRTTLSSGFPFPNFSSHACTSGIMIRHLVLVKSRMTLFISTKIGRRSPNLRNAGARASPTDLILGARHLTRNPKREWLSQQMKKVLYRCTQRFRIISNYCYGTFAAPSPYLPCGVHAEGTSYSQWSSENWRRSSWPSSRDG